MSFDNLSDSSHLASIAESLEKLCQFVTRNPETQKPVDKFEAFVWQSHPPCFQPISEVARIDLPLLRGIDRAQNILLENTKRFLNGLPANNALLWGARGMGKSSLVKAVHGVLSVKRPGQLILVEIHREDIHDLPKLLECLRVLEKRFLVFCDDLSFEQEDVSYKSLKTALEGGIAGRPRNCLLYATSNRRHLLPRKMEENDLAIHASETVEEKVSLSDRFGLWIGFHHCSQDEFIDMVITYTRHFRLTTPENRVKQEALTWSLNRGARSGRVAWQFIQDLAGREGKPI